MKEIKFILNGCDISFIAVAPADITLEQLLRQTNRIEPYWCACGICSAEKESRENAAPEIRITYDDVEKIDPKVSCHIIEEEDE